MFPDASVRPPGWKALSSCSAAARGQDLPGVVETAEALSQAESPSPCSLVASLCSSQQVTLGKWLCSGVISVHICESSTTNTHLPWTLVSIRGNGGRQVHT